MKIISRKPKDKMVVKASKNWIDGITKFIKCMDESRSEIIVYNHEFNTLFWEWYVSGAELDPFYHDEGHGLAYILDMAEEDNALGVRFEI